MSRSTQTMLGRTLFGALVATSLSFGATQALAGASGSGDCPSGRYCAGAAPDAACESYCLANYPWSGGAHDCFLEPGGTNRLCCVCLE